MPRRIPRLIRLLALLISMTGLASAQITVLAGLSPGKIAIDDHAQLTIQIRGATKLPNQPAIIIDGLQVEPSGMAQNTSINSNGQVQVQVSYTYLLSADKVGDYPIPAQDITVEGQVYKTAPLTLKVMEAAAVPNEYQPLVELEVAKQEVYEGEVVPITITLKINRNSNFTEPPNVQLTREGFAMKRFQRNPDQSIEEHNGAIYQVVRYRTSLHAIKAGQLTLGPAEARVELLVPDGSGRRDPFGGMSARQKTFKITSNTLSITAKPLPTNGKPDNFSGAVGNFTVQIQAQPLKLMEGDPIAATLYVNGTGNFESLSAPEMESAEGWRLYPAKLVQENRNSGLESGSVAYSQVLIPEKVLPKIPSFVLNYFNPDIGQYVTAKTDPLPLQITANPNKPGTGTKPAVESGVKDFSFTDPSVPREDLQGALGIARSMGTLFPLATAPPAGFSPWWIHGMGGAILLSILGSAMLSKMRARATPKEALLTAPPKPADILRQLRGERGSLRAFYSLADEFLTAWTREHQRSLPGTPAAQEAIDRIRKRRNFYCYGAEPQADQPVPASEHQEITGALKDF